MPSVLEFDFCKILQKFLCVFLILLCTTVRQLEVTGDASHIIGLKNVASCPATAEEWKKQAKIWNCKSIITTVNITLKYHCLINHWRNETLEFCGEEKPIIDPDCLKLQVMIDNNDVNMDSGDIYRNLKIAVPFIVFLVILIICALVCFCYKQKGNNNEESRSTTEVENSLL
nr:uncharacterized protein LOC105321263 isoform X2 [Crassostrea gigas]